MKHRKTFVFAAVLVAALALSAALLFLPSIACNHGLGPDVPIAERPRAGGLDVTFLVTADTHFGSSRIPDELRDAMTDRMNRMEGTAYPPAIGGKVGRPRGLLIAGDLTEDGRKDEWEQFVAHYGLTGAEGRLKMPVFEGHGNHDKHSGSYVADRIARRHGGTHYSWDWDDLHLACLGEAPDNDDLRWLKRDLAAAGRDRPVILYFHYPFMGPYSDTWFTEGDYPEKLAGVVKGFNVIAIFHGHWHASGKYKWNGIDVYNVGSIKHSAHSFAVVRVSDGRLAVCSWNYGSDQWWWWHSRAINGAAGPAELLDFVPVGPGRRGPVILGYPRDDPT